jgi:hypothetical protein
MKLGLAELPEQAKRERENFLRRMGRKRRTADQIEHDRVYAIVYRRVFGEQIAEKKRQWREGNPERVRRYMRNYDELTPGRREYKAKWARDKRARERKAAAGAQ